MPHDFGDNVLDDFGVALEQGQARFAGPLFGAGGDENQMCVGIIAVPRLANLDRGKKGLAVGQIEHLAHCQFVVGVQQADLVGQSALGQREGEGGTHRAGADNHHLSRLPILVIHVFTVRKSAGWRKRGTRRTLPKLR